MKHPVIIGLQYGDEGKGKITDVLAKQADWVIRFNGGNNAGHTLWLNGKKLVTHSVPSGVRYSHSKNFIGAGCVVDPVALIKELQELDEAGAGLTSDRLKIDYRAHVTLPIHIALDKAREAGPSSIGTTKRGIGPTYTTKTDRVGIRVEEIVNGSAEARIKTLCDLYNPLLASVSLPMSSIEENLAVIRSSRELLTKHVSKEIVPFFEVAKTKKCVLEGAQGILLDVDHGSYPYVTSSSTIPAYAACGTPFPSSQLGYILGVAKAYMTRVGAGPFETELNDETGERIRKNGHEFGATTGRPRRTGWLNVDELKVACQLSDCSHIVLTKSDILSGESSVKALIGHKLEVFPGWDHVMQGSSLHPNLEKYICAIEKGCGVPVFAVGTGPDREDLFYRQPLADFWGNRE